jgi:hypothetical protein
MSDAETCRNCQAQLSGRYCASCGQKQVSADPSLGELLSETAEELTHLEGKVPRTLAVLLFQPGCLTSNTLAGRRARWPPPLFARSS